VAAGLSRVLCTRPLTAQDVHVGSDWLQMLGPNARAYSAQVVERQSLRNRPDKLHIGESMRSVRSTVRGDLPVPISIQRTSPPPAPRSLLNSRPVDFCCCQMSLLLVSVHFGSS